LVSRFSLFEGTEGSSFYERERSRASLCQHGRQGARRAFPIATCGAHLPIGYNVGMQTQSSVAPTRRPRFRRASEPPAFRLTDDDVEIVRQVARHRFLRSTHIAALVGRSLDRTNDRLSRLFHAGHLDRPRAQPGGRRGRQAHTPRVRSRRLVGMNEAHVAALAGGAMQADIEVHDLKLVLDKRPAGRAVLAAPFDVGEIDAVALDQAGVVREFGLIPDLIFGLMLPDGSHRSFMVEIDRATMPVVRSDTFRQTSFEEKMRAYLTAYAAKQHERQFGWKAFRVLTVTTDEHRMRSMMQALRNLHVPHSFGAGLSLFVTRGDLRQFDPIAHTWRDGNGRDVRLM
jgi:hypothetical protein